MVKLAELSEATPVMAIEYVRRMPGGSQAHLMRAQDDNYYVVKFQNNPQGLRILVNEMLGASLAALLGLPVPKAAVVDVPEELIRYSEGMVIQLGRGRQACQAGLCFGSLFALGSKSFVPDGLTAGVVENFLDFLGMLVFDRWTGNSDVRQVVFVPGNDQSLVRAVMIDQGFCFGGERWAICDTTRQGISHYHSMYSQVSGLRSFEPWLTRLEQEIDAQTLHEAASRVPPEWYRYNVDALNRLICWLDLRRMFVRSMLAYSLRSLSDVFPNVIRAQTQAACQ